MASTTQLKIGAGSLWLTGLATLAAALLMRQPLLLPVGAVLIGPHRDGPPAATHPAPLITCFSKYKQEERLS